MNKDQQEAAESFEMPSFRRFRVTQLNPVTRQLEDVEVKAHALGFDPSGQVTFMDFVIREDVGVTSAIHHVLYQVYGVEEVARVPSLDMGSLLKTKLFH